MITSMRFGSDWMPVPYFITMITPALDTSLQMPDRVARTCSMLRNHTQQYP